MDLRKIVAANIRAYRIQRGLTQEQLAEKAKLNPRYLNQLETKAMNVTLDTIAAIAKSLEVPAFQLLKHDAEDNSKRPVESELTGLDAAIRLLKAYRSKAEEK